MSVTFSEFDPENIAWQDTFVDDFYCKYDYQVGYHQFLLSGSVGSAKTTLLAHIIVRRAIEYPGSHTMIGRRALPDLKGTLFQAILDHLDQDDLRKIFKASESRAIIKFKNGSVIRGISWADRRYKKVRSYEFDLIVIEEGTENDEQDYDLYKECLTRLRRQVVLEDFDDDYPSNYDESVGELILRPTNRTAPRAIIIATNPDSPAHWIYRHFIEAVDHQRHVYYSVTSDNPFLPAGYIEQTKRDLDPKMARRMLNGEWLDIRAEVIYYSYDTDKHFKKTEDYKVRHDLPIKITFDFNIGEGKPMSAGLAQYDGTNQTYHGFDEVIVHGARTETLLEEMASRDIFEHPVTFHIHGDATGKARTTNSLHSNYDIIKNFLSNYKTKDGKSLVFEMKVPLANPPIKTRHNLVNAYFMNDLKQVRIILYSRCKVTNKGFMLTALKKGAGYIEDDSKEFQHVTTAWGYMVVYVHNERGTGRAEVRGR